ncbi:MAG: alpha/beta hydrolase [Candidatus Bipolaricaulota bacterium]
MKEDFVFTGADGINLHGTKYNSDSKHGVVQVIHGMAEHRRRYEDFAGFLTDRGYSVFTYDQRGHGETASANESHLGHFSLRSGWEKVVEDARRLTNLIRGEENGLPVFLFAHSMGSFIGRDYITRYGDGLGGAILSGTSMLDPFLLKVITPIAKLEKLFRGKLSQSKVMEKIIFSSNNRNVDEPDTKFDWLSRDEAIVEAYIEDDLSGFGCTTGFYDDFIYGMKRVSDEKRYGRIPGDLPLLFISGEEDPVGGPIVEDLVQKYRGAGLRNVTCRVYPDARHELINELNRGEVLEDLISWLDENG